MAGASRFMPLARKAIIVGLSQHLVFYVVFLSLFNFSLLPMTPGSPAEQGRYETTWFIFFQEFGAGDRSLLVWASLNTLHCPALALVSQTNGSQLRQVGAGTGATDLMQKALLSPFLMACSPE
jgi:hypothetical protein